MEGLLEFPVKAKDVTPGEIEEIASNLDDFLLEEGFRPAHLAGRQESAFNGARSNRIRRRDGIFVEITNDDWSLLAAISAGESHLIDVGWWGLCLGLELVSGNEFWSSLGDTERRDRIARNVELVRQTVKKLQAFEGAELDAIVACVAEKESEYWRQVGLEAPPTDGTVMTPIQPSVGRPSPTKAPDKRSGSELSNLLDNDDGNDMTSDEFDRRATALISRLRSEELPPEIEFNREYFIKELEQMLQQVRDESLPARSARFVGLARIVVDQWPHHHDLGREVIQVETLYRNL